MPATIISNPGELFLSGNLAVFTVKTDSTFSASTGYFKVGLKVEFLGETAYFLKQPKLIAGTLYGSAEFEISKLIANEKNGHYTFPESTQKAIAHNICDTIILTPFQRVGLTGENIYGTPLTSYCLNGYRSKIQFARMISLGQNFLTSLQISWNSGYIYKFLTDCVSPKQTDIYVPEKLNFIASESNFYTVKVKKYGKTGNITEILKIVNATKYQLVEIECSYNAIKTNDYKVYEYEIWVEKNNYRYSETYKFKVDRTYRNYARYFMALNKYGVYEACRTYGIVKTKPEVSKTLIENTNNESKTQQAKRYKQTNVDENIIYDIEIGNMLLPMRLWTTIFLTSSYDVLFLKNNIAYPIVVKGFKEVLAEDGKYIKSVSLTIEHLMIDDFSNNYFSETPIIAQFDPAEFTPIDFDTVGENAEIDF